MSETVTVPPYYLARGAMDVVGIAGKAGAGKTTVAEYLHQEHGFVPQSLAEHFKVDVIARHGGSAEAVFGSAKSPELRALLQRAGTEEGRDVYGDDIWLKTLEAHMFGLWKAGVRRVVVADVRFPNEAAWVKSLGGVMLRLEGRGGLEGANALHPSETALDDYDGFDAVLHNTEDRGDEFWEEVDLAVLHAFGGSEAGAWPLAGV